MTALRLFRSQHASVACILIPMSISYSCDRCSGLYQALSGAYDFYIDGVVGCYSCCEQCVPQTEQELRPLEYMNCQWLASFIYDGGLRRKVFSDELQMLCWVQMEPSPLILDRRFAVYFGSGEDVLEWVQSSREWDTPLNPAKLTNWFRDLEELRRMSPLILAKNARKEDISRWAPTAAFLEREIKQTEEKIADLQSRLQSLKRQRDDDDTDSSSDEAEIEQRSKIQKVVS